MCTQFKARNKGVFKAKMQPSVTKPKAISLKKMQVMGQDVNPPPSISNSDFKLEVVHNFVYLGSSLSDSLPHDTEINRRIRKATTYLSRLSKRVKTSDKLTKGTKVQVYKACVVHTLLYCS